MPFVKPILRSRLRPPSRLLTELAALCALGLLAGTSSTWAQTNAGTAGPASAPLAKSSTPGVLMGKQSAGPLWHELNATQKQILRPLAASWDGLSSGHKSKWIALAQSYPNRAPAEQEKMQSRMAEWAALTVSQRERARLNFAETKKVSASERAAEWEAYQGLSSQEKHNLAAKGQRKPTGAAVAVKPVPPGKITPVPVTRHTAPQEGEPTVAKPRIDPDTLLPLPPRAPAPVSPASATH